MPVPLSEEDAIDLALLALGQSFQRRGSEIRGVDRTHLVKAIHHLAGQFDLPITRCWFKFGQFVVSPRASPGRLLELAPGSFGGPSTNLQRLLASELRPLQQEMIRAAEDLVGFFKEPLNDYLPSYYAEEAPTKFAPLYVSNFELVLFCRRLEEVEDYRGRRVHYSENLRPKLIQFHKSVAKVVTELEALETVVRFWLFVEELVLRMDFEMARADFDLVSWKAFFRRVVSGYVDQIWNLPAAVIARETVVGPAANEWRQQMARVLSNGTRIGEDILGPLRREAETLGLLPLPEETEESLSQGRQRVGTRATTIDDLLSLIDTDES